MKILLVEDDHKISTYIKKGLEQNKYIVDFAYDGKTGLDLAVTESYDLIILDRMLPKLNGIEITKSLRTDDIHTPILMLTAKTIVSERVEGLDAGADDYLGKPFAFQELLARINALTRRPKKTTKKILKIEDLSLNPLTHDVKRQGKTITLSRKEYALLEFLMRNIGHTFSKEQLTQHVWPYDSDVLGNTAQVYIGYIRNKIDKPFNSNLIKTVRGFGYKIEGNK